jgi:hypothetical protein
MPRARSLSPLAPTSRRSYAGHVATALALPGAVVAIIFTLKVGIAQAIPPGTPPGVAAAGTAVICAIALGSAVVAAIACIGPSRPR